MKSNIQRRPRFFWQGLLILLPVALMAGVALTAVVKDRAAVEREGRERAEEAMQRVALRFGTRAGVALELARRDRHREETFRFAGSLWPDAWAALVFSAAFSNGNHAATIGESISAVRYAFSPRSALPAPLATLVQPETDLAPELVFASDGRLLLPDERGRNPQPADWRLALWPAQVSAWDALNAAVAAQAETRVVSDALEAFQKTSPPPEALAAADFVWMWAKRSHEEPVDVLVSRLKFAERCGGALSDFGNIPSTTDSWYSATSEAGLPLSTLAVMETLGIGGVPRFTDVQWRALVREVWRHPSFMTGLLLDLTAARCGSYDQARLTLISRMREQHAEIGSRWALADAIRRSVNIPAVTTSTLWIESNGKRWFCVLEPAETNLVVHVAATQESLPNAAIVARLYPMASISAAFSNALAADSPVSVPDYVTVAVQLEGQSVPVSSAWGRESGNSLRAPLLARAEGRLSCPATRQTSYPFSPSFDALAAQPRFSLQMYLTDPARLYAAQHQRALVFGGLVVVSALAACVGLLAAWRAFHRQLQLNEAKSNFVSSVSHELRAPIASVRLLAESLERGKVGEAGKQREYFGFIVQECRRLSSLIENVLDFSRIEEGRKQYDFEPTDLGALAQTTVKLMEPYAAEKGVRLELGTFNIQHSTFNVEREASAAETSNLEPRTSNFELMADGKALQQALVNLIDNAIKHSPTGGMVMVGLESEPRRTGVAPVSDFQSSKSDSKASETSEKLETGATPVLLWVEDHGPGIPPEEHARIFERFYRRGSELRRETQGVGIGLSIVKHIVEAHGGRVRVRSAVGEGSRFTIELPLRK